MRISGFSFARNAQKLYYPVAESIKSVLPLCDEFFIAIGQGDEDDRTREEVENIGDPKVHIIDTIWEDRDRLKGHIHGRQTNIALEKCTGDWCIYIQADEILHERYLPVVQNRCEELLEDYEVEGLLFRYKHFWGDYNHYHVNHAWYPEEIRVIRNNLGIQSWESAQSFRKDGQKIKVADVDAEIFHYGWVRPPHYMNKKRREFATTHRGKQWVDTHYGTLEEEFNYGSLAGLKEYTDSHPNVLRRWIDSFNWQDKLQYKGKSRTQHKHEKLKYRVLTFIEQRLLGGRRLFGFKNFVRLKNR